MLQRPGQERAEDVRCAVVQPSNRFRQDVQHFAPTLRDHANAGMNKSMAVDVNIIDPAANTNDMGTAAASPPMVIDKSPGMLTLGGRYVLRLLGQAGAERAELNFEAQRRRRADVTIDGGVQSTSVTVFTIDPDLTLASTAPTCVLRYWTRTSQPALR
jgi:hypothetical protein